MTFEDLNLNKPLLNALQDLGFKTPTTIQQQAFSVILSGRDVCGIAQTGTGKTLAYLLPCLRLWKFSKEPHPQILVLVPTRELVVQVVEAAKQLSTYMNVVAVGVYGGVNMKTQAAEVLQGLDVLVATPGRLYDLILSGALKTKAIKKLVIDEVDEMLNLGFRTQLKNILDLLPEKRQNMLFSATITEEVELIIEEYFNAPVWVEAAPTGTPLENIEQRAFHVPNFNTKVNLLERLLQDHPDMSKVLVFVATKALADDLHERLKEKFPEKVGVIHSNKDQNYRFNAVNQFQNGAYRVLIATDLIARGIDISEVTHVINFDMPEVPEHYIHRIGRTGRMEKRGISITFITEKEQEYQELIENLMQYQIPILPLPENLEISDELIESEKPVIRMKNPEVVAPNPEAPAFHEKLAKNKKVNQKVRHVDKMMQKYGKPKTRGAKPRGKKKKK